MVYWFEYYWFLGDVFCDFCGLYGCCDVNGWCVFGNCVGGDIGCDGLFVV